MTSTEEIVYPVSRKAAHLVGSEIIKLATEIKAKQAEGAEIYNLTIGDFNPELFPIPEELLNGIVEAYKSGQTNYPPSNGIPELRKSVSRFIEKRLGLAYSPDSYLIAGGARPLIFAAYQAIVDPADRVIFPVPSWNNNHYTHLSEGEKVMITTTVDSAFMPTAESIAPHIEGATLIAVCSPLNPTGTVFPKEQLKALCDLVIAENKRRGPNAKPLYLIYDQIYWQLTFGDTVHYNPVSLCPEMEPYTIFIDGISKCFAATGVRVGWAFGPQAIIAKMKSILGHVGAWAPRAEQVATANYLDNDEAVDSYMDNMRAKVHSRLSSLHEGFQSLKSKGYQVDSITPKGAIYLTLKLDLVGKTAPDGKTFAENSEVHRYILENAGLAVVPFRAFGGEANSFWYRLSVGTARTEDIPVLLGKVEAALAALK